MRYFKVCNLILMMLWTLVGIMQVWNPTAFGSFMFTIVLLFSMWHVQRASDGWKDALDGWKKSNDALRHIGKIVKSSRKKKK